MGIEILGPVGDKSSLLAAINAGADAVYLGLSNFNARAKANNFNIEEIGETIRLIHFYGVKCYITVNTLVKDEEYQELISLVKIAVEAKADAFIVQDLGVARVLKTIFPDIVLHASTQMGVNNLNGAKVLERLGFSRVILARETKLEDIKLIKENTNLEIEFFVQGALCVSYSGNCYLSVFRNGKSGNRGKCSQMCRLEYEHEGENKYYLSARDLCLINDLKKLIDAGVTSFKIEGRLRHPGYVATAVSVYKKAISKINFDNAINFDKEIHDLKECFVRGDYLYDAYLENKTPSNVINKETQNHTGIKIGKLISCEKFKDIYELTIETKEELLPKSGLKFMYNGKEIGSLGVGNVNKVRKDTYHIYSKRNFITNADVYLILNGNKEDELLKKEKKIPISIKVEALVNKPLIITYYNLDASISVKSEVNLQEAKNAPLSKDSLIESLSKFDQYPFYLEKSEVNIGNVFMPKSLINETRRNALELFKEAIIKSHEKEVKCELNKIDTILNEEVKPFSYNKTILIVNENTEINNLGDDYLYVIAPKVFTKENIDSLINKLNDNNIKNIGLLQSVIMQSAEQNVIDEILDLHHDLILIGSNLSILEYAHKGYKVIVGTNNNVFSTHAIKTYENNNVINVIASLESPSLFYNDHEDIYAYTLGYNTLMNFAHCPYKTTGSSCEKCTYKEDYYYGTYKIRRIKHKLCYFELLNSKLINTYNDLDNPKYLDLRELTEIEVSKVYQCLLNKEEIHLNSKEDKGLLFIDIK